MLLPEVIACGADSRPGMNANLKNCLAGRLPLLWGRGLRPLLISYAPYPVGLAVWLRVKQCSSSGKTASARLVGLGSATRAGSGLARHVLGIIAATPSLRLGIARPCFGSLGFHPRWTSAPAPSFAYPLSSPLAPASAPAVRASFRGPAAGQPASPAALSRLQEGRQLVPDARERVAVRCRITFGDIVVAPAALSFPGPGDLKVAQDKRLLPFLEA